VDVFYLLLYFQALTTFLLNELPCKYGTGTSYCAFLFLPEMIDIHMYCWCTEVTIIIKDAD